MLAPLTVFSFQLQPPLSDHIPAVFDSEVLQRYAGFKVKDVGRRLWAANPFETLSRRIWDMSDDESI
ncbi:hypothetical protein EYF80_007509 [Liparis tanakae]|uniref:Uncharacterized protein n=1 Tax=Liparis tanakae TaxID=230148 RepID=A0A4Z2IWJ7_9TELE|nr:hypothetical protein EYF80_007509 [Liparis tanakae]